MTAPQQAWGVALDHEPTVEAISGAPVLITAQEVTFGTAAAARPRPTMMRRWAEATSVVLASVRQVVASSRPGARPAHRHYPKRYAFLERSGMAREMERL